MTVEIFEPAPIYQVTNSGPYAVPHPYETGTIRVAVIIDGAVEDLDPADFTVTPPLSVTAGDVFLAPDVSTIYAGGRLTIWRETPEEQGWLGVLGEREKGLESQLDRIVMALQELRYGALRTVRSIEEIGPIVPAEGQALIWQGGNLVPGPTAADIALGQQYAQRAEEAMEITLATASFTVSSLSSLIASPQAFPMSAVILTRAEGYSFVVVASNPSLTTAAGVMLQPSPDSARVAPRMFGAMGNGIANDRAAIQACWIWAGQHGIPADMEGLEYTADEAIYTDSGLRVDGRGAVIYFTGWPAVGGFLTNVWGDADTPNAAVRRIQTNVRIDGLILDGGRLPIPNSSQNSNLFGFSRGAADVIVSNCKARKMRRGQGGGTGGAGFGDELGATDIQWINCIAEDCFRGARVQAEDAVWADAGGASKRLRRIRFHNFTAIRCGTAILGMTPLSAQVADLVTSDLDAYDVVFDGTTTAIDCGHYPWSPLDYATYPTVMPQKCGIVNFGGARNLRIARLRVRIASDLTTRTDWLGQTGYPASGNYIGAGLTGPVGAVVWGHGRNIVIDQIELDGNVDAILRIARAATFGEIASLPPTATTTTQQIRIGEVRHVRGIVSYVFDGMQTNGGVGLDNANLNIRMSGVTLINAPSAGWVGPNGTAGGLTNVMIEIVTNAGRRILGTAADYIAANPSLGSLPAVTTYYGSFAIEGGYSATGLRTGMTYSTGVLRSSTSLTSATSHIAFYSPNGGIGSIQTNGSATAYNTSSDARLKTDPQDFDGLALIQALSVYDFAWLAGGRSHGVFAQEAWHVLPEAVSVGDDDAAWIAKDISERLPWGVDNSKFVPVLIRAGQQLADRVASLEAALSQITKQE